MEQSPANTEPFPQLKRIKIKDTEALHTRALVPAFMAYLNCLCSSAEAIVCREVTKAVSDHCTMVSVRRWVKKPTKNTPQRIL